MFIPVSELQSDWNISVNGVLHVGAHMGEEAKQYEIASWTPVVWIEGQPSLANDLKKKLNPKLHTVIEAVVFDKNNIELSLHIASNSQSSSLLNFGTHKIDYPDVKITQSLTVSTKRLDYLMNKNNMPNFINLDIQGVELKALVGLGVLISDVKYIYTEVNRLNVYEGCTNIHDLDNFLISQGFKRGTTRWQWLEGWGDALYIRDKELKRSFPQVIRGFVRLANFYKPQAKRVFCNILMHPKIFVATKINK